MKYILTQEEYNNLVERKQLEECRSMLNSKVISLDSIHEALLQAVEENVIESHQRQRIIHLAEIKMRWKNISA